MSNLDHLQDTGVSQLFRYRSEPKVQSKNLKAYNSFADIEKLELESAHRPQKNMHNSLVQNISYVRPHPVKEYSVNKSVFNKPLHNEQRRSCGHQKCKICKKTKPIIYHRQNQFILKKKVNPLLPKLPQIPKIHQHNLQLHNHFDNEPYSHFDNEIHNRNITHRKVRSQVDYNFVSQPYLKTPVVNMQYSRIKKPIKRISTEPEVVIDDIMDRFLRIKGKLYEVVDEAEKDEKQYKYQTKNTPVRSLIHPILDAERWRQLKQDQIQQENQINKQVQKYIGYQTVFEKAKKSQNPKAFRLIGIKKQSPQKMTLYGSNSKYDKEEEQNQLDENFKRKEYNYQKNLLKNEFSNQDQKQIYNIKFPVLAEIETSITSYVSLTGLLDIEQLKITGNYCREYSNQISEQFLYFGSYDHAKKQRKGIGVYVTNKMILQGKWVKSQIVKGVQLRINYKYEGQFRNNKKNGEGSCKWLNGEQYVGQWKNGLRNGQGFWSNKGGDQTYTGQWKNGQVFGYGLYSKKNYSVYKGYFLKFIKNGSGLEQFANGDKFQGVYQNGKPQGKGKYIWQCGLKYEGNFIAGQRTGKGQLYMDDLFSLNGNFSINKPNGICQFKARNNNTFIGKYLEGKRMGYGQLQRQLSGNIVQGFLQNQLFKRHLTEEKLE